MIYIDVFRAVSEVDNDTYLPCLRAREVQLNSSFSCHTASRRPLSVSTCGAVPRALWHPRCREGGRAAPLLKSNLFMTTFRPIIRLSPRDQAMATPMRSTICTRAGPRTGRWRTAFRRMRPTTSNMEMVSPCDELNRCPFVCLPLIMSNIGAVSRASGCTLRLRPERPRTRPSAPADR